MIGNISDEASAYVRAFKQKIIAPAVEDDDYTENDEDFVHLNTNASDGVPFQLDSLEHENDEEEVTDEIFRDLADEINEDDADIQEIMQFQTNLKYTHEIFRSSTLVDRDIDEDSFPAFDDEEVYDYSSSAFGSDSKPCYFCNLNLGTDECPRFSCACHKSNIAVRWAIKNHPVFSRILARLSSHSGKVKNSINLYKLNISKKSRLRIESTTRWSSSFLMLEAFKRAHNKNALLLDKPCPVTLEVIEKYMQVLQPAFHFTTLMQYTKSSISIVVPSVLNLISKWNRMEVTGSYRKLCDLLTVGFKRKFSHEL